MIETEKYTIHLYCWNVDGFLFFNLPSRKIPEPCCWENGCYPLKHSLLLKIFSFGQNSIFMESSCHIWKYKTFLFDSKVVIEYISFGGSYSMRELYHTKVLIQWQYIFKTLSDIYGRVYLQKWLTAFSFRLDYFCKKRSIISVWQVPEYPFDSLILTK